MSQHTNLDIDLVRTFVAIVDLGGLIKAANRIGRTQSAVSQQVRRLEESLGAPLFQREGRHLVLTETGEAFLAYARRLLDLNDETLAALRTAPRGAVRFGMPPDFADTWLPLALGRFGADFPDLRVEAVADRISVVLDRLDRGLLDVAVVYSRPGRPDAVPLATVPLAWLGPRRQTDGVGPVFSRDTPIPLVLFEPSCLFRAAALESLEASGYSWRITFASPNLSGIWAAVAAGLGITVRTSTMVPPPFTVMGAEAGLPPLPEVTLSLHDGGRRLSPAAACLKTVLVSTLPAELAPFATPHPGFDR